MGPDDAALVGIYTREVGGIVRDVTLPHDADFEIIVDVEAGSGVFGAGTQYETGVVVRDLTDNTTIPTTPTGYGPEAMGPGGDWDPQADQFVYQVSAADLGAGKENHLCEVLAFLRTRVADPDVSFATSPMIIITRP